MNPPGAAAAVLSLLLLTPACGADGPDDAAAPSDEEEAVERTVVAFFDAIHAYDYDALRRLVTSDFELVEDTLVLDVSGFIDFIEPYEDRGATITYDFPEFNTEVRGSVAWTRYRNEGVLRTGEDVIRLEWLESAVLLKRNGGWRIDRLQSAPVRRVGPE